MDKRQRDPERERREAERRQHQLRGCGDPMCNACNPETAMGVRSGRISYSDAIRQSFESSPAGRFPFVSFSGGPLEEQATMEVRWITDAELVTSGGFSPRTPPGPPPSYVAARKKVEAWVCPVPEQSFDDIVGCGEALAQLRDAIRAPVQHAELYAAYGMRMPRGALLSGPPGCGKTMFAKAAASEMKRLYGGETEFLSIGGAELQSMFVGETEGRIRDIFAFAREYQAHRGHPLLVFMDEAEVLLPDRTSRVRRVASWEESQVATFLAEMDGIRECGAFVLLATNRPEVIDQAVLRDGRCDFRIHVPRPSQEAVRVILERTLSSVLRHQDATIDELVFAALESLFDPGRVLMDAHAVRLQMGIGDDHPRVTDHRSRHFLLEHIVSGAMATSVARRATSRAFARDRDTGVPTGVTVADVVAAVGDIFEESRRLDHSLAMAEFQREFLADLEAEKK